jgi:hypothetical protein
LSGNRSRARSTDIIKVWAGDSRKGRTNRRCRTKGGGADRAANDHESMDAKGARELARVIEERQGTTPAPLPRKSLRTASAAPIFHWFGMEPASVADERRSDPAVLGLRSTLQAPAG